MRQAVIYARYSSDSQTEQSIEGNFVYAGNMPKPTTFL